jgi:hypothetical protein
MAGKYGIGNGIRRRERYHINAELKRDCALYLPLVRLAYVRFRPPSLSSIEATGLGRRAMDAVRESGEQYSACLVSARFTRIYLDTQHISRKRQLEIWCSRRTKKADEHKNRVGIFSEFEQGERDAD